VHTRERSPGVVAPSFQLHPEKRDRSYVPSYDWGGSSLGDRHDRIADGVWNIPGWLAEEDCRKLYELAYFSRGPILEIGTYGGRSAVTMALALRDAARQHPIVSVDIDPLAAVAAHRNACAHDVDDQIVLVCSSAARFLGHAGGFLPDLVFVDGDHSEAGVRGDLAAIAPVVRPGTLLLFHDYLPAEIPDTRGFLVQPRPIEVAPTVADSWVADCADFAGTFGWSGLYRVHTAPAA
jgi:hypothetical protein